ncbi:MAG: protein kinase [Proteobacteria bacterium]|nr:protein kinase [Pseudomonadota bacterium]
MSLTVPDEQHTAPPLPEVSGYRLLRVINHGGMSTVYLAEQLALSREVAVKVMAPQALSDEVSRRRFENEVRTIARLEHPHVVTIYEVGRTREGLPYYSMPHMSRGHLGQRSFHQEVLAGDESRVLAITRALLSALEYAHARGVVHRDVKAENVLFNDSERPMLADFGIALRRGFGPRVTASGLAVGSTAYMAPEQARGESVDGRVDLYSLGVLVWEMLTGELPYRASDALSMAVMHAQDPIPKLPPALRHWQRFMNRALAKQPGERFHDVAQMREAVEQVEKRRPLSAVIPPLQRMLAAMRPRALPLLIGIAAIAVAITIVLLARGDGGSDGFFRMAGSDEPLAATRVDPTESMMRPLPEAPLQTALENARRQIAARNLTAPRGDNAYASVLAAWEADPDNSHVQQVMGELTGAFTGEMVRHLRNGNIDRAREYLGHAKRLAQQTGTVGSGAQLALREQAGQALLARAEAAARVFDRDRVQATAALAQEFGVTGDAARRLVAVAESIPRRGELLPGDPMGAVMGSGDVALSRSPVSRAEYTRFTTATGREGALCRERVSLLRVIDPRDWRAPGFEQDDSEPVVCVSVADAEAYAQWYSELTGNDYRLPNAAESRQIAAAISGREISLWLRDCGEDCQQRQVRGSSWRSEQNQRALSASRGYDDVGFRLVREL